MNPQRNEFEPLLVDTPVMAKKLGISPKHLWNMTKAGVVPVVRLGRRVKYHVATVERFFVERQVIANGGLHGDTIADEGGPVHRASDGPG